MAPHRSEDRLPAAVDMGFSVATDVPIVALRGRTPLFARAGGPIVLRSSVPRRHSPTPGSGASGSMHPPRPNWCWSRVTWRCNAARRCRERLFALVPNGARRKVLLVVRPTVVRR
jgi:hypothetical protein